MLYANCITHGHDNPTFEFIYNDTGRLDQVIWISEGFPYPHDLSYDDHGHLVKIFETGDPGGFYETRFAYDNQGRLHELFYQRFSDPSKITFEYTSGNLPARATYADYVNGQWKELGVFEYTFSNGNMVKSDLSMNGVYKWSDTYEYDLTIPNNTGVLPLISYNTIPLGHYEEFLFFNKNLVKKKMWGTGGEYHIRYMQSGGNLAQSIGIYVQQGDSSQRDTRNFFYECK